MDADLDTVTHGPFCLSSFWKKVVIGDVQIGSNGHLYISILRFSDPETGMGRTIIEFDPTVSRKIGEIQVPRGPQRMAIDNRNHLYVSTKAHEITVIDLQTNMVADRVVLDLPCSPTEVALGSNGMLYASACEALVAVDTATNSVSGSPIQFTTWIEDIAVDSGGYLYVLLSDTVNVVDPLGWEIIASIDLNQCSGLSIIVTEQDKAYVACRNAVEVIDTTLNESITSIPLPYRCRIAMTSSGKIYLVEWDKDENVLVLDTESDKIITEVNLTDAHQ